MKIFKKSKWIWAKNSLDVDDYIEIKDNFESHSNKLLMRINADSAYAVFINNKLVKFMACTDFKYIKFYDEFNIPAKIGKNCLKIQIWHFGENFQTYINDTHGVIFEVVEDDKILTFSSERTKSRIMNEFKNGYRKIITTQQGYSFYFDNTVEKNKFNNSVIVNKKCSFDKRKINDLKLLKRKPINIIKRKNSIIIDMKEETAGLVDLDFKSNCEQLITFSFGEHIVDGGVRRKIGERDFSFEIKAKKGRNIFINPLKRIAGRYLEIYCEKEIEIKYIGIRPVMYNHKAIRRDFGDDLINKIYKTSLNTLNLCMHEHYEDCPWREQALYTMDSRNQMLCGYYAFKGFEYQKHNLILISNGLNKYGLLSICFPSGIDYPIPMFSLIYIKQVYEYVKYTNDTSILDIVGNTIRSISSTFSKCLDSNFLIPYFSAPHWNFYEWTSYSNNEEDLDLKNRKNKNQYDLILNCFYVYAVEYYNKLFNENIGVSQQKTAIFNTFYDKEKNQFILSTSCKKFSQLGNSMACLIGLGNDELLEKIYKCENMVEASLSMRCFVYDSLLLHHENYKEKIINDIKNRYKKMIDANATTFWEVEEGESAFNGAGSLCHGWSAMPIYYFCELLDKNSNIH